MNFKVFTSFLSLPILLISTSLLAADIQVTTTVDEYCPGGRDVECSLREAIDAANRNEARCGCAAGEGGAIVDSILLGEGTYSLTRLVGGGGAGDISFGDLDISSSLKIVGQSSRNTVISGGNATRVLEITSGSVTLSNVTIQNGNAGSEKGGGIYMHGGLLLELVELSVQDSQAKDGGGICSEGGTVNLNLGYIQGNSAERFGGGIYVTGGGLTLNKARILNNQAGEGGGGIYTGGDGRFTVENNSLIQGNSSTGVTGNGGGIYNENAGIYIQDSKILENTTTNRGGGIYSTGAAGFQVFRSTFADNVANHGGAIYHDNTFTLEDTTISGNKANTNGGGIWMGSASNATTISNSTLFGNEADHYGGGLFQNAGSAELSFVTITQNNVKERLGSGGGGIHQQWGGELSIANSILALNTLDESLTLRRSDCGGGAIVSLGYNILGNILGCSFGIQATDQVGTATPINPFSSLSSDLTVLPLLGNNGGSTKTVLLPANSIALNKGIPVAAISEDQRGETRDNMPDSGAYEVVCGDGDITGNEECDEGDANSDIVANACRTSCVEAACGDGVRDAGEGCDDGNAVDEDACRNSCRLPTCGDGIVQAGEDCEDGNRDNTDSCLSSCVTASCGDGFVQAGVETCDGDGCIDDCSGLIVARGVAPPSGGGGGGNGGGNGGGGGVSGGGGDDGGGGGGCSLILPKSKSLE